MAATNGLEKFSHLEDKIYRTIELTKALRQEKDDLERQLATARHAGGNSEELSAQIDQLLTERDVERREDGDLARIDRQGAGRDFTHPLIDIFGELLKVFRITI